MSRNVHDMLDKEKCLNIGYNISVRIKCLYMHHKRVLVRLEHSANSAMKGSLVSKGSFSILYGRHLKYYIRKDEVSIGRE